MDPLDRNRLCKILGEGGSAIAPYPRTSGMREVSKRLVLGTSRSAAGSTHPLFECSPKNTLLVRGSSPVQVDHPCCTTLSSNVQYWNMTLACGLHGRPRYAFPVPVTFVRSITNQPSSSLSRPEAVMKPSPTVLMTDLVIHTEARWPKMKSTAP